MSLIPLNFNPNVTHRFLLDLEGSGRNFKQFLKNNNLDFINKKDKGDGTAITDLDYVYVESVNQIMLAVQPNMQDTLVKLLALPDVRYFTHLPQFNNFEFNYAFSNAFKEFALLIIGIIQRKIGVTEGYEYLLEAVTDDYFVIALLMEWY